MKPSTRIRYDRERAMDALTACVDIIGRLEQYEETHPPVVDGAPCLHAALTAAKAAISAPSAGGDR